MPVAPAVTASPADRAGAFDLEIQTVRKRYGAFAAVDDLSFGVRSGSFFSILGPSGCGKTTLLRMIAGFIAPDAGDIVIKGRSMQGVPPNRRPVNMVFQHLALFPMMTVGENIAYGLERRGVKGSTAKAKVTDMLRRVGLPGSEGKRIDQLSGGQKQRVAIARSLVLEPALLLLDEPLGALDLKLREHMKVELKQLQAEVGTTFVYITHDQSEALVMSDQVAVMNHGRFEQLGSPQDLYYQPRTAFVAGFVGHNNRVEGQIESRNGEQVLLRTAGGLALWSQRVGAVDVGQSALLFIRPEAIEIGRSARDLPAGEPAWSATVQSVLFDGGNSTVQVREDKSGTTLQIALPLTGRLADLRHGETVQFAYQPSQAWCFAA
ncbi:MAG: ABC transporter ATP-binding protein [Hydrogenophaga sp.]|nr:ABC transporter ATP-binding protein [Hydrogenophaga sp.]